MSIPMPGSVRSDEPETAVSRLKTLLEPYLTDGLVVAFSGGVDSGFLLWAANETRKSWGGRLLAATTASPSVPQRDIGDAREFARAIGVDWTLLESSEFSQEEYLRNDKLRCYHCKSELFRITDDIISERGFRHVAYGYTASDIGDYRPGHQAAREHNVLYPLAELGIEKRQIRQLLRREGFSLADKPGSPCLSSRVMAGVRITAAMLQAIETLETTLRNGGLKVFRVRHHEEGSTRFLRLEVTPEEMDRALALKKSFVAEAKKLGYRWVMLDLEGYRRGGANR